MKFIILGGFVVSCFLSVPQSPHHLAFCHPTSPHLPNLVYAPAVTQLTTIYLLLILCLFVFSSTSPRGSIGFLTCGDLVPAHFSLFLISPSTTTLPSLVSPCPSIPPYVCDIAFLIVFPALCLTECRTPPHCHAAQVAVFFCFGKWSPLFFLPLLTLCYSQITPVVILPGECCHHSLAFPLATRSNHSHSPPPSSPIPDATLGSLHVFQVPFELALSPPLRFRMSVSSHNPLACSLAQRATSTTSTPRLGHFIAYALHRTRLHQPVTFVVFPHSCSPPRSSATTPIRTSRGVSLAKACLHSKRSTR